MSIHFKTMRVIPVYLFSKECNCQNVRKIFVLGSLFVQHKFVVVREKKLRLFLIHNSK